MDLKKNIFEEGYHRSSKTPNLDKNKFLTNVFIKNNISDHIIYENDNIYKRKRILDTSFDYIEICIKNENNEDIIMKDFFQISLDIN